MQIAAEVHNAPETPLSLNLDFFRQSIMDHAVKRRRQLTRHGIPQQADAESDLMQGRPDAPGPCCIRQPVTGPADRLAGMTRVPQVTVDETALGADVARDTFAAMVREIFDAEPVDPDPAQGAAVAAWHLGTTMLGTFAGPAMRFRRDPVRVASSGLDQILVQFYIDGGFDGVAGDAPIAVRAGDICVFDLADTLATQSTAFANISVLVPRDALRGAIEDLSRLHGMVIGDDAPMGAMLGDHLRSLVRNIVTLTPQETVFAAGGTLSLIGATIAATSRGRRRSRPVAAHMSPFRHACDYIETHIDDPSLDVDRIARALGCSRAALFRLFAGEGGVERYIRRRRLGGAARDLADPVRVRRIGEIGQRWGFSSDAVFSRAFRQAFGVSPGTARRRNVASLVDGGSSGSHGTVERRFAEWLRMLRDIGDAHRQ